jgi:hypothetical protein
MEIMTVTQIIAEWLSSKKDQFIAYHNLEQCKEYGKLFHCVQHNQGTYDRGFRLLKNNPHQLAEYGLKLELDLSRKSVEDYWKVVKI